MPELNLVREDLRASTDTPSYHWLSDLLFLDQVANFILFDTTNLTEYNQNLNIRVIRVI